MESLILLDYDVLRHLWWLLLGLLLIAFAIMDGADLGIAMLLPLVAKNDVERRVLYEIIGPVWEGNQVWLILSGGVIFAAWPLLYALSFSGFYLAMMLLLVALIIRPVAIKYRSKLPSKRWRYNWDTLWCLTGIVAALVFGVAIGNVMLGVPFRFDPHTLRPLYEGSFFALFSPFSLFSGVLCILLMMYQGAVVLSWKSTDAIVGRAIRLSYLLGFLLFILFLAGAAWLMWGLTGYEFNWEAVPAHIASNPLADYKEITPHTGAWLNNYFEAPWAWIAPGISLVSILIVMLLVRQQRFLSVIFSSLTIAGIILSFGFAVYPFLLPSSLAPELSLTLFDASASHLSLWLMLLLSIIFLPLIIAYTTWVYKVVSGKVSTQSVEDSESSY